MYFSGNVVTIANDIVLFSGTFLTLYYYYLLLIHLAGEKRETTRGVLGQYLPTSGRGEGLRGFQIMSDPLQTVSRSCQIRQELLHVRPQGREELLGEIIQ